MDRWLLRFALFSSFGVYRVAVTGRQGVHDYVVRVKLVAV